MWRTPLIVTALVLAVAAIYGQTLGHDFLWIDDRIYITNNPMVMKGLSGESLAWAFTAMANANWHPLTWVSHMLDVTLWSDWAGGHHLGNVVLHAVNSVLVFWVLRRLTGSRPLSVIGDQSSGREGAQSGGQRDPSLIADNGLPITASSPWPAAFVAALFAVHPMHVESVAWAAERKDVLCAFFFLLTLGAYGHYCGTRSAECGMALAGGGAAIRHPQAAIRNACRAWYGLSLVFFVLSLLAKPMAVTLPFVLLLLDWWPLGRFRILDWRTKTGRTCGGAKDGIGCRAIRNPPSAVLLEKLPFFALSAASCVVTSIAQKSAMVPIAHIGAIHRSANAIVSYAAYLRKLVWPVDLYFDYPYREYITFVELGVSVVVLAGLTALALRVRRRYPCVLVGWLWYVGMLVPVIGLVQVGHAAMADRYAYLPFVGIYVALAWAVPGVLRTVAHRRLAAVVAMAVLAAGAILAHRQAAFWRNTVTLYERTVELSGPTEMALVALGGVLSEQGRMDEAVSRLEEALQLGPNVAETQCYLAMTFAKMRRFENAVARAQAALDLKPDLISAYGALGEALVDLGRTNEAMVVYQEGLKRDPKASFLHYDIGRVAEAAGRFDEAVAAYRQALDLYPENWLQRVVLAKALAKTGQLAEARAELDLVTRDCPSTGQSRIIVVNAYRSLATALEEASDPEGAVEVMRAALSLDPGSLEARRDLLVLLCRLGSPEAVVVADGLYQAIQHRGLSSVEVGNDLAWIRAAYPAANLRNGEQAVELSEKAVVMTNYRDPTVLDTLAASYAAVGRYPEAIRVASRAVALADAQRNPVLANAIRQRLYDCYANQLPFRDDALTR